MYYKYFILIAFTCVSTNTFSQSFIKKFKATPATEIADKMASMLQDKLSLSESQHAQIKPIMLVDAKKKKSIVENGSIFTMRGKMRSLQEETKKHLQPILTTDQFTLYENTVADEIQKEFKAWIESRKIN